jgi:hypothetical protein
MTDFTLCIRLASYCLLVGLQSPRRLVVLRRMEDPDGAAGSACQANLYCIRA